MKSVLVIRNSPDRALDVLAPFQDRCRIVTAGGPKAVAEAFETHRPAAVLYYKEGLRNPDRTGDYRLPYRADGVQWIHVAGSGYEHLLPLDRPDVTVTNSAGLLSPFLAETVIGAMAAMNSGLIAYHLDQMEKRWDTRPFKPLREQTLLVVGLGHIGGYVADYAKAMGMRVIGLRRTATPRDSVDVMGTPEELERYLPEADVVSVHLRMSPETAHLFDKTRFAAMKRDALFINTSRGGVVDETALIEALDSGHLRGAYLDVFEKEPLSEKSPLWSHPNVLVSPHGADTVADMDRRYAGLFAELLADFLDGKPFTRQVVS
ncbi:MAG: D-2-hydroxyacid dehydrogenase [Alphaproteobacteria bacterium]|nr:D-2-hydroxyacid dehydrogenase [Alphaproteobacteria bacterium]